ncbi:MAG TPA: tRNA (N(6)-L-threonylcarbamoyladenosine(37)-C(2))-methylthiotransferase MtaB [Candidatus Kryptonia bacterium]
MEKKRVAFESLGCKLNYAETVQIQKEFRRRGFEVVEFADPADVFVINTCTVTQSADSDCRQVVRRALRNSPGAFVVVTGCYAQGKPEDVAQIEGVDLVLGAREKFELFNHVDDFVKNYHARVFAGPIDEAVEFGAADSASEGARTRAFLKVQDGCDYSCSYCTIPRVRGASRSPSISFLVDEARRIADLGFKEIVLTGVNVGDFGRGVGPEEGQFIDLLTALERVESVNRFRISSIEPNLLTRDVVDFVAGSTRFCRHFHVPLQSGADEILRKMRRRYNSSQYREAIEYVHEKIPTAGIGADTIVGFPGESNDLFDKSYAFIEDLPLTYLHVFSYSERPGTVSADFSGNIDPRVKRKRSEALRVLSTKKRYAFNRQFVGKIMKVLVEEETKDGKMFGFTSNYIRVQVDLNAQHANTIPDVLISGVSDNTALGQVIS